MNLNLRILFTFLLFLGYNELISQEQNKTQTSRNPRYQVDVFGESGDMTQNFFTKWTGTIKTEGATIGNSVLMSEIDGQINIGVPSLGDPLVLLNVNGMVDVINRIEFKSTSSDIVWGNTAPNRLNFKSKGPTKENIVMTLDGETNFVGIGTTNPQGRLEVISSTNIPALVTNGNAKNRLFMVPHLGGYGFNDITKLGDAGIFWTDSEGIENSTSGLVIAPHHYSTLGIRIDNDCNLGIGVKDPLAKLHVKGRTIMSSLTIFDSSNPPQEGSILQCDEAGNASWISPSGFSIWHENPNGQDIYFGNELSGNVGIGTTSTFGYKLAVNGKIVTEEVTVKLYTNWPDYVFEDDYNLESLENVEKYINENSHLKDVPSEQQVKDEGVDIGEMNAILLKKIEELTLYTIDQQKMIKSQMDILENQQTQINELKKLISK